MIAAIRHGQVSRTYEEDDESEVVETSVTKLDLQLLPVNIQETITAIFSIATASNAIAQSLIRSYEMTVIGKVVSQGGKQCFATLYHSPSVNAVVVCLTQSTLPDHLSFAFAELFDFLNIVDAIVLDNVSISTYVGRGEEGSLRKMSTSSCSGALITKTVPNMAIGNLVTGVSAALLNHGEARGGSVVLYAVLSRVYLSAQSMRAFEVLLPVLRAALGERLLAPTASDYAELLKRDPYVTKTENIYS